MTSTRPRSLTVACVLVASVAVPLRPAVAAPDGITTPANVQVTSTTSTAITLSWTPSTVSDSSGDVAAYHVYNGANIVATSMGPQLTVSSLLPAHAYTFTVQAYDAAGSTSAQSAPVSSSTTGASSGYVKSAYFAQWGIYGNQYFVSNVDSTGVADKINTLIYAFENIDPTNLGCFEAVKASDSTNENDPNAGDGAEDAWADYQDPNAGHVLGDTDSWSQPLKGNFNQLRELKAKHPKLRILLSLGGWTYSKYFSDAAATAASRQHLVSSCLDMFVKGNLPTGVAGDSGSGGPAAAAGIFDGIDIDWEYPGVLGHVGNHFSANDKHNYTLLLQEFRTELDAYGASIGKHFLLTAAVPSGQDKIAQIETDQVGNYLDYANAMTYDMHGAWDATGPTNLQDPLHESPADPSNPIPPGGARYSIDTAITAWTTGLPDYGIPGGFPASKLAMGFPLYYRGWTGVPAGSNHGLYQSATGPSPAQSYSQTAGTAFYKEITSLIDNPADNFYDPATNAAWIYDGNVFYTGDTPQSIGVKTAYVQSHGLAGAMIWSLENSDPQTTLLDAIVGGLPGN